MQKIVLTSALIFLFMSNLKSHAQQVSANRNPAHKCIEDICGPTAQANSFMTKYSERINEYVMFGGDAKQKDYSPEIKALFADLMSENGKMEEAVISSLKKSSSLGAKQPEGLSKAYFNVFFAMPYFSKIKYKFNTEGTKASVLIDEAATAAELKDLPPEDRAWMIKLAKYSLDINSSNDKNALSDSDLRSQPVELLLKKIHPELSFAEAMKVELEKAQKSAASLKDLTAMEKSLLFSSTTPERISTIASKVAKQEVDENDTREILQWNSNYKKNILLYKDPNSPLLNRKTPTVEEIVNKAGGMSAILKDYEKIQIENRDKSERKIFTCRLQYFLNKGLLPNQAQADNLKKDILRSKQMVIETIKTKFPSSMHQKLIKSVEDTDFIVPPTSSEFEKNFASSIKKKVEYAKVSNAAINELSPAGTRELISIFVSSKSLQDSNKSSDDSNEYCDAFKYSPMSDANYTSYGSVILSFTTATGDETSRLKTIMHELGHSVSKAISDDPQIYQRLSWTRKCLADQHTEAFPPETKKAMDEAKAKNSKIEGPYVEEDFADAVAGESLKSVRGKNSWCQLMSLADDKQEYQDSKIQAEDRESHASSLFRLLNFEIMRKNVVPGSCDKYLASIKYKKNFSSCLDLATPPSGKSPSEAAKSIR